MIYLQRWLQSDLRCNIFQSCDTAFLATLLTVSCPPLKACWANEKMTQQSNDIVDKVLITRQSYEFIFNYDALAPTFLYILRLKLAKVHHFITSVRLNRRYYFRAKVNRSFGWLTFYS